MLSCASDKSRNFAFGQALGQGATGPEQTTEGIATAKASVQLALLHKVDMPVAAAVADVLGGASISAVMDQVAKGDVGEEWDGVRNYQARNQMRNMKLGELGFFYHSVDEKRIVGVVEVCALAHPDSTTDDARWECVDIKAVGPMSEPVTLDMCKSDERLKDMVLVNNMRLSVQPQPSPVTLLELSGT